jgi:hypothetical protein
MKDTTKPATGAAPSGKAYHGFTDEERTAIKKPAALVKQAVG